MGCGLRKIRQTDDGSPGKIYSTLKRPQVETKIGVAYTYCHVDFLVGKEGKSSRFVSCHVVMNKEQAVEQRHVLCGVSVSSKAQNLIPVLNEIGPEADFRVNNQYLREHPCVSLKSLSHAADV